MNVQRIVRAEQKLYRDKATVERIAGVYDEDTYATVQKHVTIAQDLICNLCRESTTVVVNNQPLSVDKYTVHLAPGADVKNGDRLVISTEHGETVTGKVEDVYTYVSHRVVRLEVKEVA